MPTFIEENDDANGIQGGRLPKAEDLIKFARADAADIGIDPDVAERRIRVESRGISNALSPKGAFGAAQLMPDTAEELSRRYGGDPRDPYDNVRLGNRYYKEQLDRYGNDTLAAAAYNAGPGAVDRHGGVPPYRETRDYVAKVANGRAGGVRIPNQDRKPFDPYADWSAKGEWEIVEPIRNAGPAADGRQEPSALTQEDSGKPWLSREWERQKGNLSIAWNGMMNAMDGHVAAGLGELISSRQGKALNPVEKAEDDNNRREFDAAMSRIQGRNSESSVLQGKARPETQEFMGAAGGGWNWNTAAKIGDALIKNPVGVTGDVIVQSSLPSLAGMATAILARFSGGSANAAALAGGLGGSAFIEFGNEYAENRANGMPHDRAWAAAGAKSTVVGTLDAVSFKTAGSALEGVLSKSGFGRKAGIVGKEVGRQAFLGAVGDAGGSLAAGKEPDPVSVVSEAIAEVGGAPGEALSTFRRQKSDTATTPPADTATTPPADTNGGPQDPIPADEILSPADPDVGAAPVSGEQQPPEAQPQPSVQNVPEPSRELPPIEIARGSPTTFSTEDGVELNGDFALADGDASEGAIRFSAPIRDLLAAAEEFPSVGSAPGNQASPPAFSLESQTERDLVNKESRAQDESIADRETADREREAFALTSQAPEKTAGPTSQSGLFTPDGRATEAAGQKPQAEAQPAVQPIVEHVTARGKTIRGVIRNDLTKEQAKAIDPFTFRKDGGWFIRERYIDLPPQQKAPEPTKKTLEPAKQKETTPPNPDAKAEKLAHQVRVLREQGKLHVRRADEDYGRDRNTNTARRARMAASAEADAAERKQIGETMLKLADALESGSAPELSGLTTRAQIELIDRIMLNAMNKRDQKEFSFAEQERRRGRPFDAADLKYVEYPRASWLDNARTNLTAAIKGKKGSVELARKIMLSPYFTAELNADLKKLIDDKKIKDAVGWWAAESIKRVSRLERSGIRDLVQLQAAVKRYAELRADKMKHDAIKEAERALVGSKVGIDFFPTPAAVARRMVETAGIEPGMSVLEPSAGNGNIAEEIRKAGVEPDVVEISESLRKVLKAKGFNIVGHDFNDTEGKYDRIVMNPPFSKNQDIEHVQRAYGMLKTGGRLVAIVGEGAFSRSGKTEQAFRDWLDSAGAEIEKLPAGTFNDKSLLAQTGANARLVVIEAGASLTTEAASQENPSVERRTKRDEYTKDLFGNQIPDNPVPSTSGKQPAPATPGDLHAAETIPGARYATVAGPRKSGEVRSASGGLPLFSKSDSAVTRLDALLHSLITEGKSVSELLSVIERTATKPFQRELAKRLSSLGLDAKVVMSTAQGRKFTVGRNASDFSAGYDPRTNEVLIFRPGNLATNILHELMHAATYRAIRGKGEAALRMKALWMALKKHSRLSDPNLYPMSDVDEFVAAVFTDSGFRNTLQQIDSPFPERGLLRTAWDAFVDIVRNILGLPAQRQNALAEAMNIGNELMQEQGADDRQGNVLGNVEGSARLTPEQRADKILSDKHRHFAPLELVTSTPVKLLRLDKVTSFTMTKLLQTLGSLVPKKVKGGFVSDYGNPQDVVDQRNAMRGEMARLIREGGGLVDKLSGLTRAESRVAYEWMNSQDPQSADWFRNQLPPESIKTLGEIEQMIDKLSKRAMELGQLDPEAYKRNRFAYLHRSYVKHTAELTNQDRKARARAIEVLGEQYRQRGMLTPVEMSKIENTAPDWWKRKLKGGKADVALINQKFIRLERRETVGVGVAPLDGIGPAQQSRIREIRYWPSDDPIPTRFATWDHAGTWEVRGTKGKDVLLWRDFTKQEREQMGEIDEVRFAVAKTLHGMIHDVETGNYLRYIAEKHARKNEADLPPGANIAEMGRGMSIESMRRSFAPDEWVKVPETKVPGTGVAKYGALAGRFVPGPIWNDIRQTIGNRYQPFGELYSEILKAFKISKTALSPGVHMNNVMSNFVMADWHDVGVSDLIRALNVIVRSGKDPAYKVIINRFDDAGGTGGMFTITELQREQMGPLLDALRAEYQSAGEAVGMTGVTAALHLLAKGQWKAAIAAGSSGKIAGAGRAAARAMIDLYQMEDVVFRLAKWMRMKSEGQSDIVAAEAARRSFLDYEINAPWIQIMRQTGFPFISFTYRAVPMLIDIIKNKPWKLMKIGLTYGALNALGYAMSGGDEDKERKALPEEKSGSVWGMGVPKLIRMPWNDAHGSPVFLDIRRWVPVGDVLDLGQTHAAVPLFPALVPSGPVGLFMEMATNTSQFTGQKIVKDTDSPKEVAMKVSDYIYKSFTPNIPLLLGSYSYQSIMDAGKGKTDAFGRERSVAQAVSSSLGVKLSSYPEDVMRRQLAGKRIGQQREIEDNVRALTREFVRKGISRQEYEDKLQYQREKSRKIDEEYMRKLK